MAEFKELGPMAMDLSLSSLRLAMTRLGSSWEYDLFVSQPSFLEVCSWVKDWTQAPLAIFIRVHVEPSLDPRAWFVQRANDRYGSRGVA